jgi:hypothetical protein
VGAIDSKRFKKFQKVSKNIIPKNIPKINLKTLKKSKKIQKNPKNPNFLYFRP